MRIERANDCLRLRRDHTQKRRRRSRRNPAAFFVLLHGIDAEAEHARELRLAQFSRAATLDFFGFGR